MADKIALEASHLIVEPIARAETLPSAWYTDARFHAIDRDRVFARTWQLAGHTRNLRRAGDHIVATVAENPILVVRGKDGRLRAFYNVCRHRGGPLATEDGKSPVLQCKYHGWTYSLDGELKGTPGFDGVQGFEREAFCLTPVSLEVWEDFVFVNLADEPPPFAEIFSGIAERIQPIEPASLKFHGRVNFEVRANWKVCADNYLEGYHVPLVHPELSAMLDTKRYATEVREHYSLQHSPLREGENIYSDGGGHAFYYYIFPNLALNILPGRLQTNLFVPIGHDRTRVVFDFYYEDMESEAARKRIEEDLALSDKVQIQDNDICEHVQRGLASRAYDRGRFSVEHEAGVHHFQSLIRRAYAAEAEA